MADEAVAALNASIRVSELNTVLEEIERLEKENLTLEEELASQVDSRGKVFAYLQVCCFRQLYSSRDPAHPLYT